VSYLSKLVLVSFLGLLFFLDGCSEKTIEVITDSDTKIDVGKVQNITLDMIIVHPMYDEMDRGNHDFYDKDVVVDTKYYEVNQIERGDIIAYTKDNNNFHGVTRVIALPGEKVKIVKGQFYINGKKLDTFYGRAHRVGLDLDALRKRLEQGTFMVLMSNKMSKI
jgi:signal peptidase I